MVARRAHNPKVGGSNPPPATTSRRAFGLAVFFMKNGVVLSAAAPFPHKILWALWGPRHTPEDMVSFLAGESILEQSLFCSVFL